MKNGPLKKFLKEAIQKTRPGIKIGNIKWSKDNKGWTCTLQNKKYFYTVDEFCFLYNIKILKLHIILAINRKQKLRAPLVPERSTI